MTKHRQKQEDVPNNNEKVANQQDNMKKTKEKKLEKKKGEKSKKRKMEQQQEEERHQDDDCEAFARDPSIRKVQATHASPAPANGGSSNSKKQRDTSKKKKRRCAEESTATTTSSPSCDDEERRGPKSDHDPIHDSPTVPSRLPPSVGASPTAALSSFPYRHVLAPMVGASELAFRLLCRQYGTDLCYTPMMNAHAFATDESYRAKEFQTCPEDRPLVCHFWANRPEDLAAAAQRAAPYCDAIDLNLGCPQRTAFLGHFGSYLLDPKDRTLLLQIVKAGAEAASPTPLCCKIRLLDTLEQTLELCQQLQNAGAAWIAVHARYRASWERIGPGARDGPAHLDQIAYLQERLRIPIIANGNVKTYDDVCHNLKLTKSAAVMSAEGLLDNPALFFPGMALNLRGKSVAAAVVSPQPLNSDSVRDTDAKSFSKARRKLQKRLREIKRLEGRPAASRTPEEHEKISRKQEWTERLRELETVTDGNENGSTGASHGSTKYPPDPLGLALEYVALVRVYPAPMRTVAFHIRRMLKDDLSRYQVLDDLLASESLDQVENLLTKITHYRDHPDTFVHDRRKALEQQDALERLRREEGKRRAFEERMIRKAKREKRADPHHYLNQGAAVPTAEEIQQFRALERGSTALLQAWKAKHAQHCLSFHLDPGGCPRGRACAFLHIDANHFAEGDEVAG